MNNTTLSCLIRPEYFDGATPLHLTIQLDGKIILDQDITDPVEFTHDINDDEGQHELELIMLNKTYQHSPWDSQGNSLGDCKLSIKNLSFDGIELGQVFINHSSYYHNFNDPERDQVQEEFHGVMGCNGRVVFQFETPVYLWLLEHM